MTNKQRKSIKKAVKSSMHNYREDRELLVGTLR